MNCKELDAKLALFLYDELGEEERAACEAHWESCAGCRARRDETRRLQELVGRRVVAEPTPELLVRCRQQLEEALDREERGWRGLLRGWWEGVPAVATSSRAVTVLALLVFGFSLGWVLRPRSGVLPVSTTQPPAAFTGADWNPLGISDITQIAPNPQTGEVRITLNAARRVTLEGSLDDPRIRQVLLYAATDYDNPGIRLDTLEALRARSHEPEVREALLYAMRKDPNVGVRLEALEAVRGLGWREDVREAFLDALRHDSNPGIRVAAINVLVENPDEKVFPVLEQLAGHDPNPYVRLKCASALRERVPKEF